MGLTLIYDLEVFPDYFSAILVSEDGELEFVFERYEGVDTIPPMIKLLTMADDLTLVGYNSIHYDDPLLKAILHVPDMTNRQIFNVSKLLISVEKFSDLPGTLKDVVMAPPRWKTIDLLKLLEVNMNRPSLKHCSIHLEHPRLQDLPLPFDKPVGLKRIPTIIDYNRNDVDITRKLYLLPKIKEAIDLRVELGRVYDVDLRSAGDSKIANVIFEARYGIPERRETRRDIIYGYDLIPSTLDFRTPVLKAVTDKLSAATLVEYEEYNHKVVYDDGTEESSFNHTFEFNGVTFVMGQGGLHSDDPPRVIEPTYDYILRDADVGSYYPSMILKYELVPAHLDKDRFLTVYRGIVEERLEGKRLKDKVKADGLKIAINGAFGKLNFPYFWLYDPLAFYRVTLYGQLLLLDLIEKLYLAGIDCISANTDGIVCYFPKDKEDVYDAVCAEWQTRTGMNLEYTNYAKLVQLNVNSYMSVTVDGKVKTKKDFEDNKDLDKQTFVKGYMAPVIALALQAYFKDGVEPEVFVKDHKNIHDFFYTQRAGDKFSLYYVEGMKRTKLQKSNRYYVSDRGGVLIKEDESVVSGGFGKTRNNRRSAILRGKYVTVMNDIYDDRPEVDYAYYIEQVRKVIEQIEPKKERTSIFDLIA